MYYYNNYLQVYHKYHHELLEKFLAKITLVSDHLHDNENETNV